MARKHYCGRCRREKVLRDFYVYDGKPEPPCKACRRKYYKIRYAQDPTAFAERTKARKRRVADFLRQYKVEHPICTDCKLPHPPWRLDFDHINGKLRGLARAVSTGWSPARLLKEIEKCEVVCANCHRDRTHARRVRSH